MKKHLFFILCLMALALNALPAVANDYLKIHFKDGHTERHYLKLVESISTSKYDMEGNLHDDYQTQRLVISGTTYTYPLADIDSISYHKVDDEQVKQNVDNIYSTTAPIFEQCSTIEEMEGHIDEIKEMEGVEDVWREDDDIVVQIRDWHKIHFTYIEPPIISHTLANLTRSLNTANIRHMLPIKEDGTPIKVAIAFQMNGDSRFSDAKKLDINLKNQFKQMGFDAHFIPDEDTGEILDIDFYERRMFDYDIVFLDTHGYYSHGRHGFYTSIKPGLWYSIIEDLDDTFFDIDDIGYHTCRTGTGNLNFGRFKSVSEDYIKKSDYKFSGSGPHIVFSGACKTFKGKETLTIEHKGKEQEIKGSSRSVADIFFDKGADICIGYNESTSYSTDAAYDFFSNMLNGASQEAAFYLLDSNLKKEETEHEPDLIDLINPNSEYDNPKSIFLFNTQTIEKSQQEIDDEIIENGDIKLQGTTSVYQLDKNPTGLKYGFRLGILPHVENQNEDQNIYAKEKRYSGDESYQVIFSAGAIADPGTTVYYRAFTYDGIHYNWGEEKSYTITPLRVSTSLLSLKAGWTQAVNITSGYGNYKVKSSDENVATVSVYDYTISINALKEGDATITVTDKSGQTATIKVTVTEVSINTPAEAIDLGLPSGTLWASCNVGAVSPEDYGGYYAWAETEEKSSYSWSNYKYSDAKGKNISKYCISSYHGTVDNLTTIEPEDDAARVNMGKDWRIPTKAEMDELLKKCEWKDETLDGVSGYRVTGPNGNSIFLPDGGAKSGDEMTRQGYGYYWVSTLYWGSASYCINTVFKEDNMFDRCMGLTIRPVLDKNR